MKRIDFLGVPGIGKTTIYKEMITRRTKSDCWMTPEEARIKVAQIYTIQNAQSQKDYIIAALLKIGLFKKFHPRLASGVLQGYQQKIIWNEKEHYADFLEAALQISTIKEKMPLMRLGGLGSFYSKVKEVIFLEYSRIPGLVLFDESLSHKIYAVTFWRKGFFESCTKDYFNAIPPPEGIIYFKLNPEKTFVQIKQRKITMMSHRDLDDDLLLEAIKAQLEIAAIGAEVLKNRGVKILEVHTDDPLENNIEKIITFLRSGFTC
jgi:adenylate kinase